jgi:hypothetical protein
MPCYGHIGIGEPDKGTPWTSFAVTHDSLSDDILFMSSVTLGGKHVLPDSGGRVVRDLSSFDWSPASDDELYDLGVATIDAAMHRADSLVGSLQYAVVFGGVLWTQGNDLRLEDGEAVPPPWVAYRGGLDTLLTAFRNDVIEGGQVSGEFDYSDARFYYVNTPVFLDATIPQAEQYLDLEADVCADFAFCSMTQASVYPRLRYDDCDNDPICEYRWYVPDTHRVHWAQHAQNHVGWRLAGLMHDHLGVLAADEPDPFTFEVGIEVAQPIDYTDTLDYRPARLDVYDDAGDLVRGFVIDSTIANPDWTADFNTDGGEADWDTLWADLDTDFLTFEFTWDPDGADEPLGSYVYVPTGVLDPGSTSEFYRPTAEAGQADTRFEVYVDTSAVADTMRVRAKMGFMRASYEDAFAGPYVVPYDHERACAQGCPEEPPGFFLTRLPDGAARPTATTQRYTFAAEDDTEIAEEGEWLTWDVAGLEVAFGAGRRLYVKGGAFTADDVTFTAAVDTLGWGGIAFVEGSEGTLTGVTVELVKGPPDTAGDAAVEAYGATTAPTVVTLSGSFIENGTNVHGVWASGTEALVTIDDEGFVQNMEVDGVGVVAAAGAEVRVYGNTTIRLNGATGAAATGTGSLLYLYESVVTNNDGYGVVSQSSGEVIFGRHDSTTTIAGVEVSSSVLGGLYALLGSDLTAGLYDDAQGICTDGCQNQVLNNYDGQPGGRFDGKATGGSALRAEYDFWGQGRTLDSLEVYKDTGAGSVLDVTPLWNGQAPRMGDPSPRARRMGTQGASAALRGGTSGVGITPEGTLPVPDSSAVLALVDQTYTAAALGDAAAAIAALLDALPLAQTPDEYGLAFGTAARFLSHGGDPALEGYLSTRTGTEDEARPWALTALLAADAAEGRTGAAWARANTLSTEYAGTDHALPGLGMTVRLAFGANDLASAEAAFASLEAGWPDLLETESAAALVRRLEETLAVGVGSRTGVPGAPVGVVLEPASMEGPAAFRLLGARPNPFAGRTRLPFEVAVPSRVQLAVYDVLGRKVAVLADGAYQPGRYEAVFDGRGLASGLYLVQARVESVAGIRRSYVGRITLVR